MARAQWEEDGKQSTESFQGGETTETETTMVGTHAYVPVKAQSTQLPE